MNRNFALFSRGIFAAAISTMFFSLSGCGHHEPFGYVKVQGKVSYEDGSLIPARRLVVRFISQAPSPDVKIVPRPGDGEVNVKTGTFAKVTSHTPGDGIVPGEHKVIIVGEVRGLVPTEYTDVATTPLTVNSNDSPFDIKVKKPSPEQ